ncbi:MAG: hypothetical protein KAH86_03410 [Methanosarcinales archaeon]|nr:hypothetical protein [Methanosarcinales archaeon]
MGYKIETKRYTDSDGNAAFDSWLCNTGDIEIKEAYIKFVPRDGKDASKKCYIPLSNVYSVVQIDEN